MDITKIVVNGKEFQFVNESRSTRNGFAHDTTLFVNGYEKVKYTCHYLNRTWECYRYQTVMCSAMCNLIDDRIAELTYEFENKNGYKKLTAKRKEELKPIIENDSLLKEYKEVLKELDY